MNKSIKNNVSIDLGCGESKRIGSIGVDVRKTAATDIQADARLLPFRDGSIDILCSRHLIEHFSHSAVRSTVKEWVRVMRKGAVIDIECPDLRARAFFFFLKPTWQDIINIYGEQNYPGNFHHCGFSYSLLKEILESCGIAKVKRIIDGYKGIPFIPRCLHIRGNKIGD